MQKLVVLALRITEFQFYVDTLILQTHDQKNVLNLFNELNTREITLRTLQLTTMTRYVLFHFNRITLSSKRSAIK